MLCLFCNSSLNIDHFYDENHFWYICNSCPGLNTKFQYIKKKLNFWCQKISINNNIYVLNIWTSNSSLNNILPEFSIEIFNPEIGHSALQINKITSHNLSPQNGIQFVKRIINLKSFF